MTFFNHALPPDSYKDQRFGRLRVIRYSPSNKKLGVYATAWCECDCGRKVTVNIRSLRSGHTKSCGCLRDERLLAFRAEIGDVIAK